MRHLTRALTALAILAGTAPWAYMAYDMATFELHAPTTRPHWATCATDEGVEAQNRKCVWDALHQGNGEGRSFFVNADGLHFVSHARAHDMIHRN
jgi:hypothetical protein